MIAPDRHQDYCRNLAFALLAGDWTPQAVRRHAVAAAGPRKRWLPPLLDRVFAAFPERPHSRFLTAFLVADAGFAEEWAKQFRKRVLLEPARHFGPPARMQPPTPPLVRPAPVLETPGQLAGWLGVPAARLAWYADPRGINRHAAEPLPHYGYRWLPKRSPGAFRLLEEPKPVLKALQRQVLTDILGCLAPHPAAHGFRAGRSIVTNAAPHCGRAVVVRFDLRDFFPSVPAAKVTAVFDAMGYPRPVARLLAGLCTNRLPAKVWNARPGTPADGDHAAWVRLAVPHLPQGAPTSPALANLCALKLDARLAALAASVDAAYTRYADDLTFSGPADLNPARLQRAVLAICAEEGFALNPHKTRVLRPHGRQVVAGVVVNVRPNVPRAEYDLLEAILTNCAKAGPAGQNRAGVPDFRAHLGGRIAFVAMVNPARGRRLWAIFDRIRWDAAAS